MMIILSNGATVITLEIIVIWLLEYIYFVSSQSCPTEERNFTASTTEMLSMTSPGYNDGTGSYISDMDCWWIIDSGADDLQLLVFLKYDTSCPGDVISLYNAPDKTSQLFSSCGTPSSPIHYSTTQRYLRVEIQTDSSVVKSGFKLEYLAAKNYASTGCSSREELNLTETFQFLSSPNFPDKYPSNSDCRWNLAYALGAIEIHVILGDIEDGTSCDYDKYQIYDGEHRCDNNRMTVVCDEYPDTSPYHYISNGSSVVVAFESDGSVNRRGFLLRYRGIPDLTTISPLSNNTTSNSAESSDDGLVISAEILIGLVFGSLGLISFTIITTVCIIMKLRVPLEKTISATPIKTVKSNTPIRTISNKHYSHTKPTIMNGKPVKNGVSRRIVAW